ncbi:ABC transporter ATP-binding protein [Candidatus Bathyarchaeota archaeon]|nr:ABC transporter ATP-binding protein [Candidatus Bathyarchaeota archaeon]
MPLLEIKDLNAFYGKVNPLKKISLKIEEGECIGIIGPNGAGKTTLLECILGTVEHYGQIEFNQINLNNLSPEKRVKLGIRYSPERDKIFPYMSVKDNLMIAGDYLKKDELKERLNEIFDLFPILKERLNQQAQTLSGGEQQMLALALALISRPKLLLLDEPTFGLAPYLITNISNVLSKLKKQLSILIAEQNVVFTLKHSEKIFVLEHGEIILEGTPEELKSEEYIKKSYFGI